MSDFYDGTACRRSGRPDRIPSGIVYRAFDHPQPLAGIRKNFETLFDVFIQLGAILAVFMRFIAPHRFTAFGW
jgi:hypothetical protein